MPINKKDKASPFSNILSNRKTIGTEEGNLQLTGYQRIPGALMVPIESLLPNFFQVRQSFDEAALTELAADIKERGILEPLIVREVEEGDQYEIIAGERRYKAAQAAGLSHVPVIVREMNDREARFATLAENLQRQDLDPKDEQRYFQLLQAEYELSLRDIARLINKSAMYVQRRLTGEIAGLGTPDKEGEKRNAPLQKLPISQSSKAAVQYNPAIYKRVSQFFDNTLQMLDSKPDKQTVALIRESVADTKRKLEELEKKLAAAEETAE